MIEKSPRLYDMGLKNNNDNNNVRILQNTLYTLQTSILQVFPMPTLGFFSTANGAFPLC